MCLGENSAHHAVHYVNAQLGALWENATNCVSKVGKSLKPLERVRYDFALAEFHAGTRRQRSGTSSKDDMMFSALFNKPRIDFICNHEAVLYLNIKSGHVNLDYAKSDAPGFILNRARHVALNDVEVAFRVEFVVQAIQGYTAKIGQGSHIIQLVVLDYHSTKLASKVKPDEARHALPFYLAKYLEFLRQAGHHVLFSLPDFDDNREDVITDFSLDSHQIRNVDVEVDEVFGVSIDNINKYLSSKWLKAILDSNDGANHNTTCLAEYRSSWTGLRDHADLQFHVKFGAPRVKALCKREVILYFNVDELLVFDGHDFTGAPKHTYTGWQIAVVVDVDKEVVETITRIKFLSTYRVCEHLCTFHGFDASIQWAAKFKETFLDFIQYYVAVLETSGFHYVHVVETIVEAPSEEDISGSEDEGEFRAVPVRPHGPREEIGKKSRMCGFDFIQAITQFTIIEHFKGLWSRARESKVEHDRGLFEWSHGDDFKGTFGAFTLRILPNGKAVIWINLEEGSLKPLRSSNVVRVSDWSIAFEVGFKLANDSDLHESSSSWLSRFTNSFAWKQHGSHLDTKLKHLCLDFSKVRFIYELSKFEGLTLGNHNAVGHVMGAVQYLTKYYFPYLTQNGHHVLHSIPVWVSKSNPPTMGITELTFQVYAKNSQEIHDYRHLSRGSDAIIVLLGMTEFRPLPSTRLEYTVDWVPRFRGNLPHGAIMISRNLFLERMLKLMAQVNTTTTIVPIFPGVGEEGDCVPLFTGQEGGEWELALTTWARRYRKKDRRNCQWEVKHGSQTAFKWDHTDKWNYEHEGSFNDKNNGLYTVSCQTKNNLQLPNAPKHGGLDIVVNGEVTIQIGFKGQSSAWNSKATAKWSVTLSLNSLPNGGGISVDIKGDTHPPFEVGHGEGEKSLSTLINMNALQKLMHVDVVELAAELKQTIGGVWAHCYPGTGAYALNNPFFNSHGDIWFELCPYVPFIPVSTPALKARPSVKVTAVGQPTPARPAVPTKQKSLLQRIGNAVGNVIVDIAEDVADAVVGEHHSHHHHEHRHEVQTKLEEQTSPISIHDKATIVPMPHNQPIKSIHVAKTTPVVASAGNGHAVGQTEIISNSGAKGNGHTHEKIVDIQNGAKSEVKTNGSFHVNSTKKAVIVGDIKGTS